MGTDMTTICAQGMTESQRFKKEIKVIHLACGCLLILLDCIAGSQNAIGIIVSHLNAKLFLTFI